MIVEKRKRVAVVDFDGTLSEYDGWKGSGVFGEPIRYSWDALHELHAWGWMIVIWSVRNEKLKIEHWLKEHDIPFDSVNSCEHNPEGHGVKPVGDVYFDDRDCHVVECGPYNWVKAMRRVRKLYQPPLDTWIDDASIWSSRLSRFRGWLDRKFCSEVQPPTSWVDT